jgi:hypothetical protein
MASKFMVFAKFVSIRQRNNSPNYVEVLYVFRCSSKKIQGKVQKSAKLGRVEKSAKICILHLLPPHRKHYEYFLSSWARSGKKFFLSRLSEANKL